MLRKYSFVVENYNFSAIYHKLKIKLQHHFITKLTKDFTIFIFTYDPDQCFSVIPSFIWMSYILFS